ncbi:MAG: creatininase family protein [Lewinella sp.]|nr:creatininase family protein [Lewinella sp.]
MKAPFPFERAAPPVDHQATEFTRWEHHTWPELRDRLTKMDIALLPTGAIEQHGPHLPLDIDAFDAEYLARRVAQACAYPHPMVLPLLPYGVSYHHDEFPGTISVSNKTLARLVHDIGLSVARQGIKKLIIINGHGDNAPTLNYAAQLINRDTGIFVAVDTGESSDTDLARLFQTPNDIHAGEIETSTTLAVRPDVVRMDQAVDRQLDFGSRYLDFDSPNAVPWYAHTHHLSVDGTLGNPTLADAERGRQAWEIMVAHLVTLVESLRGLSLEEIYQKRY